MSENLRKKALTMLENDDDLFVECITELDCWNGFADGFSCWDMSELDNFYYDQPATKLLQDLTEDFNINDTYFYFSMWGLESTNDIVQLYRDNVTVEEVLDALIENYPHITIWGHDEFEELLDEHLEELEE